MIRMFDVAGLFKMIKQKENVYSVYYHGVSCQLVPRDLDWWFH